jgi:N-acetylglucosaminyl-diphospho-decaprenol L-rhamnosyltransferase
VNVDVSVILVNYNTAALLPACLDKLLAATGSLRVQILIVDNASKDASVALLRERYRDLDIVENSVNVGFARANNQVLARARGRYVLLLNVDAFVASDSLRRTVAYMDAHPRCGVLGVRLEGRDGERQPCCRYFPTPWNVFLNRTGTARFFPGVRMVDELDWPHDAVRDCDWVPGCFYLVRREVVEKVQLFDPRFFLYYEEVDHCRRVKNAGWQVSYFPDTTVVHIGGESSKSVSPLAAGRQISGLQIESELLYFRKHHGLSGAWTALLLATVGDAILLLKAVLRLRPLAVAETSWRHAAASIASFWRTGAGRRATR